MTVFLMFIIALSTFPAEGKEAETITWTFDGGSSSGWSPLSKTVNVSQNTENTASSVSKGSLRIHGRAGSDELCAESGLFPLNEFRHYRITAWVFPNKQKKDESLPDSRAPHLMCEYKTENPKSSLGIIRVDEITPEGGTGWMKYTREFRTPWGTRQCRLILASGSGDGVIDYRLDDVTIEPIERYIVGDKYRLDPIPASLERVRGVHPRIYLSAERIAGLKKAITTTHAPIWNEVRAQADRLAKAGPPPYQGNDEGLYDEQWWQAGNSTAMITLAMAYLLSDDRRYLDSAREWALATCAYKTWGVGWADGIDCMTGHNLFGLAIVYDWCYDSLDREARAAIRETIVRRAPVMFRAAAGGVIVPNDDEYHVRPWPEWDEAWLQNHLWVNSCGLAAAGLAVFDEVDEASQWTGFALDRFGRTLSELGPDGASHEGINYWSYGIEHLLKFMYLARELLGEDLYGNDWFSNAATYRMYMSLPRYAWKRNDTTVDYGDSYRRDYAGPDHLLRALAAEYRDGHAQWLARALDEADVQLPGNGWLNLIWYDPTVPEKPPDSLPTLHHFTDMDFVSARSDWSGDESFVFFKCGPYIGHKAIGDMVYCPSSTHHTHPDQNHFTLFACGEWLIRDDGVYGKYTGQHNTLLIDDGEQFGGGDSIFDAVTLHGMKLKPRILRAVSTPKFDHMAGEAAEVYPKEKGLRRFTRHLLYLKPDVLIVADDIVLEQAHRLELRFHPEMKDAVKEGAALLIRGGHAVLRFEPLTTDGIDIVTGNHDLIDRRYNKSEMFAISLKTTGNHWRNAVALSWSDGAAKPVPVSLRKEGDVWIFSAGDRKVALNWETGNTAP